MLKSKNMKKFLLLICLLAMVFSSCTMEKRLYRPGHNIEWSHSKKKSKTTTNPPVIEQEAEPVLSASNDNSFLDFIIKPKTNYLKVDTCDNIVLRSGDEISAKVIEVGTSEIKYKKCQNLNGPLYSISKKDVFMIKYANGTKDIMPEEKVKEGSDPFFDDEDYAILNDDFKAQKTPVKKLEGIGLAGFIIVLSSIPIWWWILASVGLAAAIVSFIFGIISMARAGSHKGKFKGRGFGIVSFIIALIMIVITLALVIGGFLIL